jgi:hypothetical protein
MPQARFEPTILVLRRSKAMCVLDRAATGSGFIAVYLTKNSSEVRAMSLVSL